MKSKVTVEELLRWRAALAETEAPPPPRAAALLEQSQPWWESNRDQFRDFVEKLFDLDRDHHAHAAGEPVPGRGGQSVPALVVGDAGQRQAHARILDFAVREGVLHFCFQFENAPDPPEVMYEATFLVAADRRPILVGHTGKSSEGRHHLDICLPPEIAAQWESLKVTDRLPFRLILRPLAAGT